LAYSKTNMVMSHRSELEWGITITAIQEMCSYCSNSRTNRISCNSNNRNNIRCNNNSSSSIFRRIRVAQQYSK